MKNLKNIDQNDDKHIHLQANDNPGKAGYYCPMRCEGDKVYDKPGRCPVCNMKLIPVED